MRLALAGVLTLVVLLAGCSGVPGGGTGHGTETPTGPGARTPTGTTTVPDGPPNATSANTVDFETLTDRQQEAFLDALDGEVSFAPSSPCIDDDADYHTDDYAELVNPFRTHEYVTYDGQYYGTTVATGPTTYLSRSYRLRPTTTGLDDPVVEFGDLSAENRSYVRRAIHPDEYTTPHQCGSPDVFDRFRSGEFLSYDNETYAAEITLIEDAPKYVLSASEYEGQ